MINKVIIAHASALRAKYGAATAQVESALDAMVQADQARGLCSAVVAIDSTKEMAQVGGRAVHKRTPAAAKRAIDAICQAWHPEYVLLLGGPDIIPFVPLRNPCYAPHGDRDRIVPSDLPYACAAPYSEDPACFLGPTRVVGRIPDIPGAQDPQFLVELLRIAASGEPMASSEYRGYFAISARAWQQSTSQSLATMFGSSTDLALVPPAGPNWPEPALGRRIHFINCHGASAEPTFYGQHGDSCPVAETSTQLIDKVSPGTVVAAECCYGAELVPSGPHADVLGICLTYLQHGAYAFLGSSTIAYGPSAGNGQADLLCQYFLLAVLGGASVGRALLEARHRFAAGFAHLDPVDLKTLAQFYLLGDPSLQAVKREPHALATTRAYQHAFGSTGGTGRALRRERLVRTGTNLSDTLGAVCDRYATLPPSVRRLLEEAARESGLGSLGHKSFGVKFPHAARRGELSQFASRRRGRTVHMVSGRSTGAVDRVPLVVTLIATLEGEELVHLRRVHSHGPAAPSPSREAPPLTPHPNPPPRSRCPAPSGGKPAGGRL